jgi:hypothetical protein
VRYQPFPATSAPGLGSPRPLPHRDVARPCHICTGTGLTPATSASGLGLPQPHLHRDWAHPGHFCIGTGLTTATSAPGLGSPRPHLHRDCAAACAHHCHICARTGLTRPHLHRDRSVSRRLFSHGGSCSKRNPLPPQKEKATEEDFRALFVRARARTRACVRACVLGCPRARLVRRNGTSRRRSRSSAARAPRTSRSSRPRQRTARSGHICAGTRRIRAGTGPAGRRTYILNVVLRLM